MTNGRLDSELEAFILSCINSVEQMEILLLLRLKIEMDSDTINRELRTSLISVQKRLADLTRKNLVGTREHNGALLYFYSPPDRYAAIIDTLAQVYATHRVAVINTIFSKPQDPLKDFSEAFRLREKDK